MILILSLSLCFAGCGSTQAQVPDTTETPTSEVVFEQNPIATITMADGGEIVIELFPEIAPITVENFVLLAESGYYDGTTFHRIIEDFMIQGGYYIEDGTGTAATMITGEFYANGIYNNISHTRGVISMARSTSYDSGSSQFFIVHQDSTFLDGYYAGFGIVLEGMDIVDNIATVETNSSDAPLESIVIKSITITR